MFHLDDLCLVHPLCVGVGVCVHVCVALTGQFRRSPMLLALRSSSPNISGVGFSLHSSILTAWLLQHCTHAAMNTHTHI